MTIGYYAPTHVYFGAGAEDHVAEALKSDGARKVLVHFGGGSVKRSGLLDKVEKQLADAGIEYVELGGVVPNPRVSLVRKGIELVKEEGIDYILAVGGGSTMDSGKFIAVQAVTDYDCTQLTYGVDIDVVPLPHGCISTLSGTGSEAQPLLPQYRIWQPPGQ